ncbi:flagellar basal-body rod protein FlgG [Kordiimonas sp. SCSIO 12610]|uniref:flagellar basal-body rod protein FlgG n=1 Tax=Kordiimonas sp. SCSIO 12610 TaxID=2829597 RepID=UPI00210A6F15|nr:flagellar basal-body rod protein FlgG [Kordiimonas sp. SCSIO 12610]UTW54181.1 flagellar basal-body rod protein FlgG [Kordiimonas sp. SCSIO 12610]
MRALSSAATGMLAQQLNVDTISNNIANLNTTGFKRQRAEFQDLLYENIERAGSNSSDAGTTLPSGIQVGVGVRAAGIYRIDEQGSLENTGNTFDIAINGNGFFRIQLPDGQDAYTRAGSFQIDQNGQLVTPQGFIVQPQITIPQEARDISVNEQGEVSFSLAGQVQPSVAGQLDLAIFPNSVGLEAIGGNLLLETQASGAANIATPGTQGFGTVLQGFLERSNVNAVSEITALISAQRAYELNSQVIQTADEMLSTAGQLR